MGNVLDKAADGIGNALATPFKAMLEGSCEDVCSGVWDVTCFISHLCVSDLIKLFLILVLCYITLLFIYLFFKLGVIQCVGKTLCRMYCSVCKAYWSALGCMSCFFWHKLTDVERVNRHRRRCSFPDVESSENSVGGAGSFFVDSDVSVRRKRKLIVKGIDGSCHSRHHRRYNHHRHHLQHHRHRHRMGRPMRLKSLKYHRPRKNVVLGTETPSKRRRFV